jgi:hypothetical protein
MIAKTLPCAAYSGADPEAKNNEGHTPLVEAVIEKKVGFIRFLFIHSFTSIVRP